MSDLLTVHSLMALVTLAGLEIILGIDNIVFLVVITGKLPPAQQPGARRLGLALAMGTRIALLFAITLIMRLTTPLFAILDHSVSGRDLVLLLGGLFLVGKATFEIHDKLESHTEQAMAQRRPTSYLSAVIQIAILDIVFSLDSVITAVGMTNNIWIMVVAIVLAVLVMLIFSGPISRFVHEHPTIQMLAFSFLILVGVFLMAEGLGKHIDRGYIYVAMAFSLAVELLNMRLRRNPAPPEVETIRE